MTLLSSDLAAEYSATSGRQVLPDICRLERACPHARSCPVDEKSFPEDVQGDLILKAQ